MARVYGETRDGKPVCGYMGCESLAVWRNGMWIACDEHWKLLTVKGGAVVALGEPFKIPDPLGFGETDYVLMSEPMTS